MRCVLLALLLPTFAVAGGQGNEGEKLFRDLEKKVAKAKTVRVAFASKLMRGDKEAGHFKGVIDLDEGDRARVEMKGEPDGKEVAMQMVSDGKKLKVMVYPPGKEMEQPLPKNFGALVRTALSRVGPDAFWSLASDMVPGREKEPERFQVSDFKLGANAKVEGREARVIEYKVNRERPVTLKLWLDAKTHLPLKRELSDKMSGFRLIETYSEFTLDKKGEGKSAAPPK